MQEAYRPLHNKYSLCCSVYRGGGGYLGDTFLGRGVPTLAWCTYLGGGIYLGWGPILDRGTPPSAGK